MKTKVYLREEKRFVDVSITGENKPKIKDHIKQRWQKSIDLIAKILDVPSGLIMRISKDYMNVFLKSDNDDNPYPNDGKDKLSHGLYCETVIGKDRELHIENALNHHLWKDNPDVDLKMIAYYGLPIKWGDGSVFGTICVLDNKLNSFSKLHKDLLSSFKEMIELDLMVLEENQILENESDRDFLTNILNRRGFNRIVEKYYGQYIDNHTPFSLIMMDIDHFKKINDVYGHITGDRVLKLFAKVILESIDEQSHFARFGGDEFVLVTKIKTNAALKALVEKITKNIRSDKLLNKYHVNVSFGFCIVNDAYKDINEMLDEADKKLYIQKNEKKRSA